MPKADRRSRRTFITAASGASVSLSSAAEPDVKVLYAELLPHEFRKRLGARPIAYLPLGTLEWHGEHLPLGSDAIQSEGLMIECARRFGGIVMPPIHLGPDRGRPAPGGGMLYGMDYADSTRPPRQLDGSCYWIPKGLHLQIVDAILEQLKRAGFRAVFADGHGPSRWSWAENLEEREARYGLKLFGVTRDIASQWKSQVDHAARNETSLMMHFRPHLVDLSQLSPDRSVAPVGVGGQDPRDAGAAYGRECLEASIELVRRMFVKAGLLA
ncbi:MAG: creatininase family protein [Bryobacterales bacterium]|nr:creatininase family protein [Bryobacterales bacterium]